MGRSAANKIERGFGRNEGGLDEESKSPTKKPKKPHTAKFEPKQPQIRKPGTGCIYQISNNLWEGSYSPRLPDGKRKKFNVYAKTKEECEKLLAEMIKEKKAEIKVKDGGQ